MCDSALWKHEECVLDVLLDKKAGEFTFTYCQRLLNNYSFGVAFGVEPCKAEIKGSHGPVLLIYKCLFFILDCDLDFEIIS